MNLYESLENSLKEDEEAYKGKVPKTEEDYVEYFKKKVGTVLAGAKDLADVRAILETFVNNVDIEIEQFKDTPENQQKALEDDRALNDKCVLCGAPLDGWGNNPYPLSDRGNCCDKCNVEKVIPARLSHIYESGGYGKSLKESSYANNIILDAVKDYGITRVNMDEAKQEITFTVPRATDTDDGYVCATIEFIAAVEDALADNGMDVDVFDEGQSATDGGTFTLTYEPKSRGLYSESEYDKSIADKIVEGYKAEPTKGNYYKALDAISKLENDNRIDKDKYDECIKAIQEAYKNRPRG